MDLMEKTRALHGLLLESYFSTRDLDTVTACFDTEIMWFGTGKNDTARIYDEAVSMLRREQESFSGRFQIRQSTYEISPLQEGICHVFGEICLDYQAEDLPLQLPPLSLRYTALYRSCKDEVKLYRLHLSQPSMQQGDDEFFPHILKEEDALLQRLLDEKASEVTEKNRLLETLMNNIPGGVQNCLNDAYFTILHANKRLLSMFGYEKDELAQLYGNRFIEIIHPDDRERVHAVINQQLESNSSIELEYRVLCHDGSYMWVLDKCELVKGEHAQDELFSVIVDISEQRREREELRMAYERYRIVMNQTDDIIFEWDFTDDRVFFSQNWQINFSHISLSAGASGQLLGPSQNIHPDDLTAFHAFIQKILDGNAYTETEIRIRSDKDAFLWYCVRVTIIYDKDHSPLKAVGVMINIDDAKRQTQMLTERASRDSLTGLYNRAEAFGMVTKLLSQSRSPAHTLMMMDIDNFKQINDTRGHLFGDTVLRDIGHMLKGLFRSTDIVGRVGGDEFVVFLPGTNDQDIVSEKAKRIIDNIKTLLPPDFGIRLSCSIGIACTPGCGSDFHALYASADQALYRAKNSGKDRFCFFETGLPETYMAKTSARTPEKASDQLQNIDVREVFHTLYTTPDLCASIQALLRHLCQTYHASRAYIFELSGDGKYYNNTFEWCEEGFAPQIEHLQNVSVYEGQFAHYDRNFNENGVFYCKDVRDLSPAVHQLLTAQGIQSILQCAIMDGSRFRGFIGFDDCREKRYWVRPEVNALKLVSEIVSVFLLKYRDKPCVLESGN